MSSFSFHAEALKTLHATTHTQKKTLKIDEWNDNDDKNNLHMKMKHRSCCLHRGTFCNFYLYVDMYVREALKQKSDENISLKADEC